MAFQYETFMHGITSMMAVGRFSLGKYAIRTSPYWPRHLVMEQRERLGLGSTPAERQAGSACRGATYDL